MKTGTGTIKSWNYDRGFGFISYDGGRSIFCHIRNLIGILHPTEGQVVTFEIEGNHRNGKPEAVNVQLLSKDEAEREKAWASRDALEALAWDRQGKDNA